MSRFLCLLLFFSAGCATMIRGTHDNLQLTSSPEGANATLADGESCRTPCSFTLSRNTSTVVTFSKDGCDPQMVSVYPSLAGAGVILGGIIDYGDGAVYNLVPNPVVASLHCRTAVPIGASSAPDALASDSSQP
jgi:hypothetical protein